MRTESKRIGRFTSSQIWKLMTNGRAKDSFGKPALTYIKEKIREQRLGRSVTLDVSAKPTSWGKLVENRVFDILGTEYRLCSTDTIVHPQFNWWSGSPDAEKHCDKRAVIDIKCPITLTSFCDMVDALTIGIDEFRNETDSGEVYYWQLVSNAILLGVDYAELIIYCPYKNELEEIRQLAANFDGVEQKKFAWIFYSEDEELPYLNEGGYYKNLYTFNIPITEEAKLELTQRVIMAGEKLTFGL